MCPACWATVAMITASVATTGALGITAARLIGGTNQGNPGPIDAEKAKEKQS